MRIANSKIGSKPPPNFVHQIGIPSPAAGIVNHVENMPDPLIALRTYGEGMALKLTGQQIVAPLESTVVECVPSCQYITLKTRAGIRLHLRFVQDVARLMAERFVLWVKNEQSVKPGDCLFSFDLNLLKREFSTPCLSVTIQNAHRSLCIVPPKIGRKIMALEDNLMTLYL